MAILMGTLILFSSPMFRRMVEGDRGALIYPFILIYLNRRLPRAARPRGWQYAVLLFAVVFFGFFFVNSCRRVLHGLAARGILTVLRALIRHGVLTHRAGHLSFGNEPRVRWRHAAERQRA